MNTAASPQRASSSRKTLRIGSVSYLNAKPLIHHLFEDDRSIDLRLAVPAKLLAGLENGEFDIALLPVIDYQRLPDARIVPSGGIGCDGPTLTVRIFSRKPIAQIQSLAGDTDSHTSVALAKIILAEQFSIQPKILDLAGDADNADAILLIGDKVVTRDHSHFSHQLDLGEAWKSLTGKPFVFAVWTTRAGVDLGDLPSRLARAREVGLASLPQIVEQHAQPLGWPRDLAMKYLSENLKFEIGPRQIEAIRLFHELAARHGIISALRPLILY